MIPPGKAAARHKWLATATAMLGTFSVVLAATILTVALPAMMESFHVGQQAVQWTITGFLAAMTTTLLVNAWCVARFGLRTTYVGAMLLFCGASVLGALAPSLGWLILARVLQGAAAGVIQPLGMIVIYDVFAPSERGKGFGIYGLGVIVAPSIGPVLGGVLVDWLSWRASFLIALPFCGLGIVMALTHLRGRDERRLQPELDIVGLVLLAGTLATLLWALSTGQRIGWHDAAVQLGLGAGSGGLVAFVLWQRFFREPLLDLAVFRLPGFVGGFLVTLVMGAGLYASTYLVSLYLQQVTGMTPSAAGLAQLPAGIGMALIFPFAGRLTDRVIPTWPILGGLLLFIISCALLGRVDDGTGVAWLVVWVVLGRVGLGLMMPSVTNGSLRFLPLEAVSQGSGAVSFARQLGGSVGVSLISITLDIGIGTHEEGFAHLDTAARHLAHIAGYHIAFMALAALFVMAMLPLWVMHRHRRKGRAA